jgi:hypothetical protein
VPKKVQKRKRSGIFIYCTENEKARLKRMAMKTKRGTLSGYVMQAALERLRRDEASLAR